MESLVDVIGRLKELEVPTRESLTEDILQSLEKIKFMIVDSTEVERSDIISQLEERCATIQSKRQTNKSYSNLLYFPFIQIKKKLQKRDQPSTLISLNRNKLLQDLIAETDKNGRNNFPDTINEYIALTDKQEVIIGFPKIFTTNSSILFYVNPSGLQDFSNATVVTGHCLAGFEPNYDIDKQLRIMQSRGIIFQDVAMYRNVANIIQDFSKHIDITNVSICLDTSYYASKIGEYQLDGYDDQSMHSVVTALAREHSQVILDILSQGIIHMTTDEDYQRRLDNVIDNGLLDFMKCAIEEYNGRSFRKQPSYAREVAKSAATYLLPVFEKNQHTIAIESAMNARVPSVICLPYLQSCGMGNMMSFIGIHPMMNTKGSHGAMYYGSVETGKIFLSDIDSVIHQQIDTCTTPYEDPKNCFIINYCLSTGIDIPKECSPQLCNEHKLRTFENILEIQSELKK